MVWGFCSTQAFGPNVVTGHGVQGAGPPVGEDAGRALSR